MPVSKKTYELVALEDPEGHWELHCGVLRQKPDMSVEHNYLMSQLWGLLFQQLDPQAFAVRSNSGRTRRASESYYIPDVIVIPMDLVRAQRSHDPNALEAYDAPLPLVVEVWSPSTGDYDVESKLPEYQRRGDLEIWRIHPYERTLTAWRRHPDGTYTETLFRAGVIRPVALPGVTVDLDTFFD